jgi:arabinose-5-phosphate isomerase
MQGLLTLTAGQAMTPTPRTVTPDDLAEKALAVMKQRKITCLFVLNPATSQTALGILNIHDLLRAGIV